MFEIELIICLKIDLALNNLQKLICHKAQTTKQPINSIELDKANTWEDIKLKVLSAACNNLGVCKRKYQDWFAENYEEINALLEMKHRFFPNPLPPNLSCHAKEGAIKRNFEVQEHSMKFQKAGKAQLAADTKNLKLFYLTFKEMYGPQQSIFTPLKSKHGNITLIQPEDIQAHWCEYYAEFLNGYLIVDESVLNLIQQREPIVSLEEVPSWDEINISVKQMNNNKAPGMDDITAEILKWGGDKMINLLELVIYNVWESEAPQDWRDVIFVSHKKGSKLNCGRNRGIFLLCNEGKIFSRIILNRLISAIVNNIFPESQYGFRTNCGTV